MIRLQLLKKPCYRQATIVANLAPDDYNSQSIE